MIDHFSPEDAAARERDLYAQGLCILRGPVAGRQRLWVGDAAALMRLLLDESPEARDAARVYAYHREIADVAGNA